jgi:predicted nuclease with TOPRIM domain
MSTITSSRPAVANSSFAGNELKALLLTLNEKRRELQIELVGLKEAHQLFAEPDQKIQKRIDDLEQRIENLDNMETQLNNGTFLNKCNYIICTDPIGFERLKFSIETRTCLRH